MFVPDKGEIPSLPCTIGGLLIMSAIAVQGLAMQRGEIETPGQHRRAVVGDAQQVRVASIGSAGWDDLGRQRPFAKLMESTLRIAEYLVVRTSTISLASCS